MGELRGTYGHLKIGEARRIQGDLFARRIPGGVVLFQQSSATAYRSAGPRKHFAVLSFASEDAAEKMLEEPPEVFELAEPETTKVGDPIPEPIRTRSWGETARDVRQLLRLERSDVSELTGYTEIAVEAVERGTLEITKEKEYALYIILELVSAAHESLLEKGPGSGGVPGGAKSAEEKPE